MRFKFVFVFYFFSIVLFSNLNMAIAQDGEDSGNLYYTDRCVMEDLPFVQKGYELFLGKFKALHKSCCLNAVKSACGNEMNVRVCRGSLNSDSVCAETCKEWNSDCKENVSNSDLKKGF